MHLQVVHVLISFLKVKRMIGYLVFLLVFQVQGGVDVYAQYGHGAGSWGAYDMQRAQGYR